MTTTSHRRIALLTGASIATLGIATPVLAAPHDGASPGTYIPDGNYPGFTTNTSPVTICAIAADNGALAGDQSSPCFYGVVDTTGAAANALVVTTATGEIKQVKAGGAVALTMINAGSAEVGAIAVASTSLGNAAANAEVINGISQMGTGTAAAVKFTNNATLLIDALALASASSGDAAANAEVITGIKQNAVATAAGKNATAALTNNGSLTISATASATASSNAAANAEIIGGIMQTANSNSGKALTSFTNEGALDVVANATAAGSAAAANAEIIDGIQQNAVAAGAAGTASAVFSNTAAASATFAAHASASATSSPAAANAEIIDGIQQNVNGNTGADALASVVNAGVLGVSARRAPEIA